MKSQLHNFIYCPLCGSKSYNKKSDKQYACGACGLVYYQNTAAATAAIIRVNDKILLTERKREPFKGTYDLPGGFVDNNETAEEGLQREIMEELNLKVSDLKYINSFPNQYLYKQVLYHTLDIIFEVRLNNLEGIQVADDVAGYMLVAPESLDVSKIGLASIKKALTWYIKVYMAV